MHSIKKSHIRATRLAITIRELSNEFKNELGEGIEKLALTYQGVSVGCIEGVADLVAFKPKIETGKGCRFNEIINCGVIARCSLLNNIEFKEVKEIAVSARGATFCVNSEFMVKMKKNVMDRIGLNLVLIREKLSVAEFGEETSDDGQMNVCVQKCFIGVKQINGNFLFEVGRKIAEWTIEPSVKVKKGFIL